MSDIQPLLQRQAAWQKNRERLSWPDKIHMVEALQKTLRQLRGSSDRLTISRTDSRKPNSPTYSLPLIVKCEIVWPLPSKTPLKSTP